MSLKILWPDTQHPSVLSRGKASCLTSSLSFSRNAQRPYSSHSCPLVYPLATSYALRSPIFSEAQIARQIWGRFSSDLKPGWIGFQHDIQDTKVDWGQIPLMLTSVQQILGSWYSTFSFFQIDLSCFASFFFHFLKIIFLFVYLPLSFSSLFFVSNNRLLFIVSDIALLTHILP